MRLVTIYTYIYYFLVTIFTFRQIKIYQNRNVALVENSPKQETSVFILAIFITLMIGLRPVDDLWFADSALYYHLYYLIKDSEFVFRPDTQNIVWDNLFAYGSTHGIDLSYIFLGADILYFGGTFLACRKLFPKDYAAAFVVFLGAFSTLSYSYNGIKAGIAAAMFILAIAYRPKRLVCVVFLLLSWGFHHSMHLPILCFLVACTFKNPKVFFVLWFICLLIALGHFQFFSQFFASITDEQGAKYLSGNSEEWIGRVGFRGDFVLYSAMPIWVAYTAIYKKHIAISSTYRVLLGTYMITNAFWLLCMYVPYNNRIAYLSWQLYPMVLIYPFLMENWGEDRYEMFAKVMKYHLLFTLFMELIYYNILR